MKQERYRIYHGDKRIGTLVSVDDKPQRLEFVDGLKLGVVPIQFYFRYKDNGQRVFEDAGEIMGWIEDRGFDRGRMNLPGILLSMGLKEYDAWEIFKIQSGRNISDEIWVEKEGE